MVKAVVLGASGGIGQPLSLLLKSNPIVTELGLYDIVNTPGVAADLSHISTGAKVTGYLPADNGLEKTLAGADIVVIPAGIPRKPGMSRDDLFKINAGIVRDLAIGIADFAPNAFVLVISNPVNSTVPIVAEVLRSKNVFDPKRVFGVTTLDVVRSSTFVAEVLGDLSLSKDVIVPVVGGHSGATIVPLLSQSSHPLPSTTDIPALVNRIQYGGDEVVKAKDGAGSATLSMAYAGAQFANAVLTAAFGSPTKPVIAPTFVSLTADPAGASKLKAALGEKGKDLDYFSTKVHLGKNGVERFVDLGEVSAEEKKLLDKAVEDLAVNITTGVNFLKAPKL